MLLRPASGPEGAMKKAPLIWPVRHKQLDLLAAEYECVQVKQGSCRVLGVRSVRGDTEEPCVSSIPSTSTNWSRWSDRGFIRPVIIEGRKA